MAHPAPGWARLLWWRSRGSSLRPDYYEFFPRLGPEEVTRRLETLPPHLATLLVPENIRSALSVDGVATWLHEFLARPFATQREALQEAIRHAGVSARAAAAVGTVERHLFVPERYVRYAYLNAYVPYTAYGGVTPPGLVALMLQQLEDARIRTAIEIGAGSGYHAACLVRFADAATSVVGYEIDDAYAELGRGNLRRAQVANVEIETGDGLARAFPAAVDLIYLTAAGDDIVRAPIVGCLRDGGVLQMIRPLTRHEFDSAPDTSWLKRRFGTHGAYCRDQWREYACLVTLRRDGNDFTESDRLYDVTFVPLVDEPHSATGREPPFDPFAGL